MTNDTDQSSSSVAKVALGLGILSTFIGIVSGAITLYRSSTAGKVEVVLPLSGYALVRGINPEGTQMGPWSSDHIVLPLEWSNGTGTPVLIKSPTLLLRELGDNEKHTGKPLKFFLVGELPEASIMVSDNLNTRPHTFTNSIVVDPHSVKQTVSVFRVNNWDDKNKCLRFHQGQNFRVALDYKRIPQDPAWDPGGSWDEPQPLVDNLPILKNANYLSPYGADHLSSYSGWDYYSLLPGSRASEVKDLREDEKKHYKEPEECS